MKRILKAFERYISRIRSENTRVKYVFEVRRFLEWLSVNGMTDLNTLPRNTLVRYSGYLIGEGFQPSTLHGQMVAVKRFIGWCQTEGIEVPPQYLVELPKVPVRVKDVLPKELFRQYFEQAAELNEPMRTATLLLPCSGLRAHEIVSLPLKCLRKTVLKKKETLTLLVKGKGGDERLVPLLNEGAEALMVYLKGWRKHHPDKKWMFPGRSKGHMTDRALRLALQRVRKPLKMSFTPHTMRRTYLTTLYRQGVDPMTLAKIAGHKNLKTLLHHYLYLDEHDLAAAVHNRGGSLTQ